MGYKFTSIKGKALEDLKADIEAEAAEFSTSMTQGAYLKQAKRWLEMEYCPQLFLFAGTDLKGRVNSASYTKGYSFGGKVQVGLLSPVVKAYVQAGGSYARAQQKLLVVIRGPSRLEVKEGPPGVSGVLNSGGPRTIELYSPLTAHVFSGVLCSWKGELGAEASVGYAWKWPEKKDSAPTTSEDGILKKIEDTVEKQIDEIKKVAKDPVYRLEMLAAELEARAGVSYSGDFTKDNYEAVDPFPLDYAAKDNDDPAKDNDTAKNKLHEDLGTILKHGSTKRLFKVRACELVEKHPEMFNHEKLKLHPTNLGFWKSNTSTKDFLAFLQKHLASIQDGAVRSQVHDIMLGLEAILAPRNDRACTLVVNTISGGHKGAAFVRFAGGVSASNGDLAANAKASAEAAMQAGLKTSTSRFQTRTIGWATGTGRNTVSQPVDIMTTFDTRIDYKQFNWMKDAFKAELKSAPLEAADAILTLGEGQKTAKQVAKAVKKKNEEIAEQASGFLGELHYRLNTMSYRTAITVWERAQEDMRVPANDGQSFDVPLLPGSGVAFGESFVIKNLKGFYKRWDKNAVDPYVGFIASKLGLDSRKAEDVEKVHAFLRDEGVIDIIERSDPKDLPDDASLLIEATYRIVDREKTKVVCKQEAEKTERIVNGNKVPQTTHVVTLTNESTLSLLGLERRLQAIRLRYRKKDLVKDDKLFSLGVFKLPGLLNVEIAVEKIDRAGSEAAIELASVYFDDGEHNLGEISKTGTRMQEVYELAVPPVPLFTL